MSKVKEKSLDKPAACLSEHGGVMMWALASCPPAGLMLGHDSSLRGFYISATSRQNKQNKGYPFTSNVVAESARRQQQDTFPEDIK